MSGPNERTRAVLRTRQFLMRLAEGDASPGVPGRMREEALSLLKHFPTAADMVEAHAQCPKAFGPPTERIDVGFGTSDGASLQG